MMRLLSLEFYSVELLRKGSFFVKKVKRPDLLYHNCITEAKIGPRNRIGMRVPGVL